MQTLKTNQQEQAELLGEIMLKPAEIARTELTKTTESAAAFCAASCSGQCHGFV